MTDKPKRKVKDKRRFSVYLPVDVFNEIEALREKVQRSRNFVFVLALRFFLKSIDVDKIKFENIVTEAFEIKEQK